MLAERLGREEPYNRAIDEAFIHNIFNASPLHDIGKVASPDRILRKSGKLTEEEFRIMKEHPVVGATTMESVRDVYPRNAFINMGISIARSHHERWDGRGYPDGLKGEEIPWRPASWLSRMSTTPCAPAAVTRDLVHGSRHMDSLRKAAASSSTPSW
jgi:putative two-component system response regulator